MRSPDAKLVSSISIHAPARGATFLHKLIYKLYSISIHAPARGATCLGSRLRIASPISIHAPARGATLRFQGLVEFLAQFQFTPLREGRLGTLIFCMVFPSISIHAPARGATHRIHHQRHQHCISIHAPARGATKPLVKKFRTFYYFNSRPCERGDW